MKPQGSRKVPEALDCEIQAGETIGTPRATIHRNLAVRRILSVTRTVQSEIFSEITSPPASTKHRVK